ncbi:MAG: class I SAM-dependent methyltransferase [Nanoarchaeota archaeon]|nr:class I SAM-dependent methyltransferase [Nanoarchaeota archaeon]
MVSQKEIWDKIAPEWNEYKTIPAEHTINFLKKTSGKVLDLGSGSGRHLVKIKDGKMYLVDFSKEMLKLAEKKSKKEKINAEFKQANIWEIPYEDEFFDYAICISALHCVETSEQREKVIRELYRVLKNGGKAEIGVWNIKSKRFKNINREQKIGNFLTSSPKRGRIEGKEKYVKWTDKGERYYYLYDEKEVHNLFKKAGFKIISTHNSEMMINFIVEKNNL